MTLVAAVLVGLTLTTVAIFRDLGLRRRVISGSRDARGGF
jgi:hypothetical protein